MKVPSGQKAMQQIVGRLAELVDVDRDEVRLVSDRRAPGADGIVKAGPFTFVVEWKGSGTAAPVSAAVEQVRGYARQLDKKVIPLVAVPFMGEAGRERCAWEDVAWMDLSGNARISAPGLRILVEGKPSRYKRRGRPSTAFAPKSSRIARWLLLHPSRPLTQRELARSTGTDEGHISKIVGRLEDDNLVVRDDSGAVKPRDPDLLLDAWREAYDFSKHQIIRGHVAARTGDALLRQLAGALEQASAPYAATGLAAAWLLDRFAGFRTVTLYLAQEPSPELLAALSFREDARGANVWLVIPNDEGVFHGAAIQDGIRCVHPIQAYLDLHAHPERADEAAQKLRAGHLSWKTDG
jgi:hypothetical protein